jgi:4-amino-4-deoxy-L-arabinose transferase-like glycosyltransferase
MNTDLFRRAAVILLRVEAVIILGLVAYLGIASFTSKITHPSALIGEVIFGCVGAFGLYVASKGFAQGKSYGRAPAVLANGIALGVAYFMFSGGDVPYLAVPLALLAGATFVASLFGYKE